ncbi:2Fe-2S iron-sulfur cluster-binding protein [Microbispora siamensis]|uniref:Phenylacetic acid degradation protein n=1 Tax=Microbispora siamensis TaxID=564413 RepID=A0ABQ4GZ46_9ACTN|nr:2Fe-2S iron-sulfur cluster-binding protein [Microbispora siamensis]GIH66569.1 phenylacetic acid degradation protein [Microbispora siamensis]
MPAATTTAARARLRFHTLTVAAVEPVAADGSAVAVTLRVPDGLRGEFAFVPGQHVTVAATVGGAAVRRSYSLCSVPDELDERGTLRIGVRVVPGGVFSTYAARSLAPGDTLDVLPPVGAFGTRFDSARRRRYAAIAGGSGITPVLSLVRAGLATEPDSTFTLLYGNRTADSVMFADELADLKDRHPRRLHLVHAFSRENPRLGLGQGRLDAARLAAVLPSVLPPGGVSEWFLCGPAGLVRDARRVLSRHGAGDAAVHAEFFHPDEPAERAPRSPAPPRAPVAGAGTRELCVVLEGRATTVRAAEGQTILDAALAARPELPYSCRNGVCATCRARVVEGRAVMSDHWALTDEEVAAGYVLTCRAVPETEQVTVDFDMV